MRYIDIYNKLGSVQINENEAMPIWQRVKLTIRIANCSSTIKEEIFKYLDSQEQPEYSITIVFNDSKTKKATTVSCQDIQEKMHLQPLPALLYMDWLRREPQQAASFVMVKDDLPQMSKEQLRAHVDSNLLAKADKVKEEEEQNDLDIINSGE